MTGDTKYSELAGDETVMEITLQAQWKEAEPTETPEPHRDTGTYRDAGTHRQTESHAEAGQHRKARIRKRHGNGRQRGYRRWQPPWRHPGRLWVLERQQRPVLMAYRRRANR